MRWLALAVCAGCGTAGHAAATSSTTAGAPDASAAPTEDASVPVDASADAPALVAADGAAPSSPASCVSAAQLQAWQSEIDAFAGGFRPTGSPAHEGYIALLAKELTALGATDVHTEPYPFEKWTPSTWSLDVLSGPSAGPVALSAYVPYSGSTGPLGVEGPLTYVTGWTIPIDGASLATALGNPTTWIQNLTASIAASLAAAGGTLLGHVVVFELPKLALSLGTLTGDALYVNDPGHTLSMQAILAREDLSAMLVMPAMLDALVAAGALGGVAVLDAPPLGAQGESAPFFETLTPNLPAVYVDRTAGAALRAAVPAFPAPPPTAKLVVDATVAAATSENLIGFLPGVSSTEQILVGSHTDGPNSIEDNGPAAILGLVQCLAALPPSARPRTLRVVLSGGHFAASLGLNTYVAEHFVDLATSALAVMELEHLGAREWAEVSPGVMGLTGNPEPQFVYTWPNAPLVAASEAFAAQFPRTIVATPTILGEGPNFRFVPLVQFITMPKYLLLSGLPVTSDFTDFDLMQRQVLGFVAMEQSLAAAPASALGP
jgi:hypothetical protein